MAKLSDRLKALAKMTRTPFQRIPFGPWMPDRADLANPGLMVATNVIPAHGDYHPFFGPVVQSDAIDSRALGATAAKTTAGDTYFYVGNASKLYSILDQAVDDQSIVGGYTTAAGESWEFTIFGASLIATNYGDPVQSIVIGAAGDFADHFTSTNKPKARHIGIIRDFLVTGNINHVGGDGVKPNRVWWSGIDASVDMDPDSTTQADFQDLPEGGAVQRIVSGVEYGLIFQESMIRRMVYVGSPLVFTLNPIDRQRGTPIPNSVISLERKTFFIAEEGFHETDGSSSVNIGDSQVDKEFWDQFDIGNKDRVSTAIDPVNKLVAWAFPGTGASAGAPNRIFIYNYVHKKWAQINLDTEIIVGALTQGFTLEGLDSVSTDIDDGTLASFDSPQWQGGKFRLAGFDADHKLVYFTGDSLAAILETGEFQFNPLGRSKVRKARALVDGTATVTTAVASRSKTGATASFDSAASDDTTGEAAILNEGRYHKFRVNIASGGWTHAQGIEVLHNPTSAR